MRQILLFFLSKKNYLKLEKWKKRLLPTRYDKVQNQLFNNQLNFYSQLIKPNQLCFDIGANVGLKTNLFLQLKAKVISVEPQQNCIDLLNEKYGDKAVILQKGVGAIREVKEFYISNNSQLSSF